MNIRRLFERLFLLAGLAMIGVWAWSEVRYTVWQDWGNWAFERELRRQSATPVDYLKEKGDQFTSEIRGWLRLRPQPSPAEPASTSPSTPSSTPVKPSLKPNALIGRLIIPRLNLSATVREGSDEDTLAVALGHIPATALPGQPGNVGIAGHRDQLFRGLREIRRDDRIELQTLSGNFVYRVASTQIVKPTDVSVLNAASFPELTLVTCYPFYYVGAAPERFIVKARQLVSEPSIQDSTPDQTVAAHQDPPSPRPTDVTASEVTQASSPKSRIGFNIPKDHSRQLAPGIWFGVTDTDVTSHWVSGWMWLMPDRRTIWLRQRSPDDPVVFYSIRDGKRRELRLTSIANGSVTGYLTASN